MSTERLINEDITGCGKASCAALYSIFRNEKQYEIEARQFFCKDPKKLQVYIERVQCRQETVNQELNELITGMKCGRRVGNRVEFPITLKVPQPTIRPEDIGLKKIKEPVKGAKELTNEPPKDKTPETDPEETSVSGTEEESPASNIPSDEQPSNELQKDKKPEKSPEEISMSGKTEEGSPTSDIPTDEKPLECPTLPPGTIPECAKPLEKEIVGEAEVETPNQPKEKTDSEENQQRLAGGYNPPTDNENKSSTGKQGSREIILPQGCGIAIPPGNDVHIEIGNDVTVTIDPTSNPICDADNVLPKAVDAAETIDNEEVPIASEDELSSRELEVKDGITIEGTIIVKDGIKYSSKETVNDPLKVTVPDASNKVCCKQRTRKLYDSSTDTGTSYSSKNSKIVNYSVTENKSPLEEQKTDPEELEDSEQMKNSEDPEKADNETSKDDQKSQNFKKSVSFEELTDNTDAMENEDPNAKAHDGPGTQIRIDDGENSKKYNVESSEGKELQKNHSVSFKTQYRELCCADLINVNNRIKYLQKQCKFLQYEEMKMLELFDELGNSCCNTFTPLCDEDREKYGAEMDERLSQRLAAADSIQKYYSV